MKKVLLNLSVFTWLICVFFLASTMAQKPSKVGAICGDASKPECSKRDEYFQPFDLVFNIGKFELKDSSSQLFGDYFYAVVLDTFPSSKDSDDNCQRVSEDARIPAQQLFPRNKAFAYTPSCRNMNGVDWFVAYEIKGVESENYFLAVYGGQTQAETQKILSVAKKNYPAARIVRMRIMMMQGGDV